jgi:hypothetical protein
VLDLNQVRANFAEFLASNANRRHSLDAALMHVVERAYQQGIDDAGVKIEANSWKLRIDRNVESGVER